MPELYRVFPFLPRASPDEPGGALYVPPQGGGRLDNPDLYAVFYASDAEAGALAESFGRFPEWTSAILDGSPALPGSVRAVDATGLPRPPGSAISMIRHNSPPWGCALRRLSAANIPARATGPAESTVRAVGRVYVGGPITTHAGPASGCGISAQFRLSTSEFFAWTTPRCSRPPAPSSGVLIRARREFRRRRRSMLHYRRGPFLQRRRSGSCPREAEAMPVSEGTAEACSGSTQSVLFVFGTRPEAIKLAPIH